MLVAPGAVSSCGAASERQSACPAIVQSDELLGVWKLKKWGIYHGRLNISRQVSPQEFEGELIVECPRPQGCYLPRIVESMKIVLSGSVVQRFPTSIRFSQPYDEVWTPDGFLLTICNGAMSGQSVDTKGYGDSAMFVRQ